MQIELEYSKDAFESNFEYFNHDEFKQGNKLVPKEANEIQLLSIKVLNTDVITKLQPILDDYEKFLQSLFEPMAVNMNFAVLLSELKTQMAQVRIT